MVAERRFGGGTLKERHERGTERGDQRAGKDDDRDDLVDGKWHALDGEPQTDALFQKEIVERMGHPFYQRVFVPAIEEAHKAGKSYESIRDAVRKGWKPA